VGDIHMHESEKLEKFFQGFLALALF